MLRSGLKRMCKGNNNYPDTTHSSLHMFCMNFSLICSLVQQLIYKLKNNSTGLALIDVFSRKAAVMPIMSKQPADITAGIMEGLNKLGKPQLIYSDDEGSLNNQDLVDCFKDQKIENYKTRGHPHFVERVIRTFKDMLFKRVDANEKKGNANIQWVDYIPKIILTYNGKMVHSAHDMTPSDAHKKGNHFDVKMKLEMNRMKSRKYPPVRVGDEVKIYRKKGISEKERTSNWSSVGMNRPYLRSEILKV